MKKIILSICAVAVIGLCAMADNVDVNTAQKAGATYLASVKGQKSVNDQSMTLAYTFVNSVSGAPTLYAFNHEGGGYVIVSGVNSEGPVIGYSETGSIDPANMPEAMKVFLQGMSNGIEAEQNANVIASDAKLVAWKNLSAGHIDHSLSAKADGDIQLFKYHWTQEGLFNSVYPIFSPTGKKCIVGCGATAAAQIMAYWRYPKCAADTTMKPNVKGEYYPLVHFGEMTYRYDLMPLSVSGGSKDQKKNILDANSSDSSVYETSMYCYHVSVGLQSEMTSGSTGTNHVTTLSGLRDVFKYDANDIRYIGRGSTPADKWDSTIRNEIWGRRPVFYRATSVAGEGRDASGHAFVICGHRPTQNKFYVNWGWGISGAKTTDGWFDLSLTDTAQGYVFSAGHGAIIGIHPPIDSLEALGFTKEMLRIQDLDRVSDANIGAIHPNPASHFVNIPCSFAGADNAVLEVYNVQGRLMECRQVNSANELISINVQNYPKGVYTCRLRGASSRFVVQ